ncbi:MipA/OmpV family protein [Marinomonas mediterranea]|uniref:MipA/OmpV family protein n=1 Tax=Marinomonas mediterranea TaxID=119864 RepID=UPI00234B14B5|nr:MipA/OmpV family protein [Marinomonas mediterranea]WCN10310.1 hypothetical protein GV055_15995 [Marinomonas mediterranea]
MRLMSNHCEVHSKRFAGQMKRYGKLGLTSIGIICGESVYATDFSAMLGAAVVSSESVIVGEDDDDLKLYPYAKLEYGNFSISKDGIGLAFELNETDSLSFLLSSRDSAFDSSNAALRAIDTPDDAIDLGLTWSTKTKFAEYGVSGITDVSDTHNGYELSFSVAKPMRALGGLLKPSVELSLQSEGIVDYYYGVSASEATSELAAYKGKSALLTSLGVQYLYQLTDSWVTLTSVSYTHLGSGITDSSIVDKDSAWSGVFGIAYKF